MAWARAGADNPAVYLSPLMIFKALSGLFINQSRVRVTPLPSAPFIYFPVPITTLSLARVNPYVVFTAPVIASKALPPHVGSALESASSCLSKAFLASSSNSPASNASSIPFLRAPTSTVLLNSFRLSPVFCKTPSPSSPYLPLSAASLTCLARRLYSFWLIPSACFLALALTPLRSLPYLPFVSLTRNLYFLSSILPLFRSLSKPAISSFSLVASLAKFSFSL